jgi:hypothetical protein
MYSLCKRTFCTLLVGLVSFSFLGTMVSAQTREELLLWESIKNSERVSDFQGYLDKFPNGTFSSVASRRISALSQANTRTFTLCKDYCEEGNLVVSSEGIEWRETHGKGKTNRKKSCGEASLDFSVEKDKRGNDTVGFVNFNGLLLHGSPGAVNDLKEFFAAACRR